VKRIPIRSTPDLELLASESWRLPEGTTLKAASGKSRPSPQRDLLPRTQWRPRQPAAKPCNLCPSLPGLCGRLPFLVRLVPGYYGPVRLLLYVHVRRSVYGLCGLALIGRPRRTGNLPVLVHVVFSACAFLDYAGPLRRPVPKFSTATRLGRANGPRDPLRPMRRAAGTPEKKDEKKACI
jgi:hypothetical protein